MRHEKLIRKVFTIYDVYGSTDQDLEDCIQKHAPSLISLFDDMKRLGMTDDQIFEYMKLTDERRGI